MANNVDRQRAEELADVIEHNRHMQLWDNRRICDLQHRNTVLRNCLDVMLQPESLEHEGATRLAPLLTEESCHQLIISIASALLCAPERSRRRGLKTAQKEIDMLIDELSLYCRPNAEAQLPPEQA